MKKRLKKFFYDLPLFFELRNMLHEMQLWHGYRRLQSAATFIQAVEAIKAGDARCRDPKHLLMYGAQCWSQNDEDGIIAEIFRRVGTTTKTFLEIGVENGTETNTTLLLAMGWSGWWIDGSTKDCASIREQLKKMPGVAKRLTVREAMVSPENVKQLLADLGVPAEIDLFSLDIDQDTYHVWRALDQFRPRVVVVEYNPSFPADCAWIHPYRPNGMWNRTQAFGASLKAFEQLGTRFGYSLVGCNLTGANAFFVRNDLVGDKFAAPFSAENHYQPARYYLFWRLAHPASFYVENEAET